VLLSGLLAISLAKAHSAGVTHDECLTFEIVKSNEQFANTLNHHLLNTWCMTVGAGWFGSSELALRVHSVLAHVMYLVVSALILRRATSVPARIAGFALLNLNLFALDFFFLARGYGMALAFELLSLYLLLKGGEASRNRSPLPWMSGAAAAGALSVLANYAFINYYLPACAVGAAIVLRHAWRSPRRAWDWAWTIVIGFLVATFVAVVLMRMFKLRGSGEMYWGGEGGFVSTVIGSLVDTWIYAPAHPRWMTVAGTTVVTVMACAVLACALHMLWRNRRWTALQWVVAIGLGSVSLTIAQRMALGTPFPIERHALYFIPPFAVGVALALSAGQTQDRASWIRAASATAALLIASVMAVRFGTALNLEHSLTWRYDAYSKDALERVDRDRCERFPDEEIRVGAYWALEPSLNYYRSLRAYQWMQTVVRDSLETGSPHYIYACAQDAPRLTKGGYGILHSYPESGTALLRRARGGEDAAPAP